MKEAGKPQRKAVVDHYWVKAAVSSFDSSSTVMAKRHHAPALNSSWCTPFTLRLPLRTDLLGAFAEGTSSDNVQSISYSRVLLKARSTSTPGVGKNCGPNSAKKTAGDNSKVIFARDSRELQVKLPDVKAAGRLSRVWEGGSCAVPPRYRR
ncbi:hypothetical protein PAAG_01376 [Paracoccidioides lutzii Pb01]|uniref:Uncharacterized protein n=1 Tax=Paracoccidioides lutzii (strain ATCC MYA-826 / Pb01) TaxID=502779 RepID=C1GS81_PARBA|nr:hypothetical protein PAAG_01376 [Paracoccidioides lutzii Pb01]EEH38914.2 hypothetical protein PAAG_01376 [Paracoccidioides lutzii Pb01]